MSQSPTPPTERRPLPPRPPESDATGGVIPYKNPPALIAYYLSVFSLLPIVGLLLAVPAIILGIIGLRNKARHPHVKGTAHAWVGIVLGGLMTLLWAGVVVMTVISIFTYNI